MTMARRRVAVKINVFIIKIPVDDAGHWPYILDIETGQRPTKRDYANV
jgi:hypothetical protein